MKELTVKEERDRLRKALDDIKTEVQFGSCDPAVILEIINEAKQ